MPFSIDARINRAYARSLTRHGPTPQGVFWNSTKTQKARFAALTAAIRAHHARNIENGRPQTGQHEPTPPVIADIGCGYGALLDYIDAQPALAGWGYRGIDVTPSMVQACKATLSRTGRMFHNRQGATSHSRLLPGVGHIQFMSDQRCRPVATLYLRLTGVMLEGQPPRHRAEPSVRQQGADPQQHLLRPPRQDDHRVAAAIWARQLASDTSGET
jgi:SAM-dependent methyltransferase